MTQLSTASLSSLDVPVPTYDRSQQSVGIVHLGFGAFHRAHQALYLDELMSAGGASDWAICGVGLMPGDRRVNEVMRAQDCLYTVVLKHADGTWEPRVVGSVAEHLFAPDDPEAVLARMTDPGVRIVSLTITEGGYEQDPDTGEFAPASEAVLADLDGGSAPRSAFGFVIEALRRRRDAGLDPFVVLSCDNVQGNGEVAHRTFVAFARRLDADLGDWIEQHVTFPNCMVDRITPVTTDEDRAEVARRFGVEDGWPILAEPFGQWV
ncbi:mannitol dehydrogenase family protein, partial [Solicola sp. PLA-1-18]|uniref:mannitol dehydrogenase family protein n=1 Tax=Solicola sp. PLA-1-18 TaxID=3380532 RepID=UPI003B7990BD